jgi:hypothetical protein
MATKKVRVGQTYYYVPVLIDRIHPPYNVSEGDCVRVRNYPGCPKAGTMGHCHVEQMDGEFGGLVCCNSLLTAQEYREHLQTKIADIEKQQNIR